jgi:YYY domain-containing protein
VELVNNPIQRKRRGISGSDVLVGLLLLAVLVTGGYFRFIGQNWDEFTLWHPDERFFTGMTARLNGTLEFTDDGIDPIAQQSTTCLTRYPDTGGSGGYFDAQCSPMNPNNIGQGLMAYGTLPAFLTRWTADVVARVTGDLSMAGYYGGRQVGRLISATAEMLVILVTFFIGLRLHGKWAGLIAAALYACAVFSIQQSHFYTADAVANLMVALAILGAVYVQTDGRLSSYLLCGAFCGLALASRVNTLPVVGLLLLAAGLRALPLLDGRLAWNERGRTLTSVMVGLALALLLTFLMFRIFNPYAFTGPGFFGLRPNFRWLQDVNEAQHLVSGNAESPPNWQWAGRTPYLFPFANMVLWGMGIALGLTGWAAWVWSGWRLVRGRSAALTNILLFVWVLVYFGYLGRIWVMSMRYYFPIYPVLALLAAWALIELVRRADRLDVVWRKLTARALTIGVVGFTALWAVMFTNIYRTMFPPAASTNWAAENLPADFSMQFENITAPLVNIPVVNRPAFDDNTPIDQQASRFEDGQPFTQPFTAFADGAVTKVSSPHLGDPNDDPGTETLQVKITVPGSNQVLAEGTLTADLQRDASSLGSAYDIPLSEPVTLEKGKIYNFTVEVISGGPVISSGPVVAWEGQWDEVSLPKVCAVEPGASLAEKIPPSGVTVQNCVSRDVWGGQFIPQQLQIYWEDEPGKRDVMQRGLDNSDYLVISTNRRYDTQSRIPYRWPMTMRFYEALWSGSLGFELVKTFQNTFEVGPLRVSDQYLPTYTAPKWLNEFEAEEAFHVYDHPAVFIFKKTSSYSTANTQMVLESASLNKIDSVTKNYNCPQIPLTAQANFYCDPQLVGVVPLYSVPASKIPTALQLPPDLARIQSEGGTWSDRFHSGAIINTQPVVSIVGWWVAILIFGWAVWPLLFVIFPGLADRGYSFAKAAGLLIVGWLAWFVSSARIPLWSQGGVLLALVIVALFGLLMSWRKRGELVAYVREHGRRLLWIEALTLLAFLFFLVIRLTNPDLWHPNFGGEKPMDFAYFNGVLRSTVFPPIDPWHSGGYINYYYFGYVIVGSPVLLLGMMPSIAYNLILPTLFALTGMGAFSIAFNLVSAWREKARPSGELLASDEAQVAPQIASGWGPAARMGNPWLAGVAALLLAVVLGNLDTPRIIINEGLMKAGHFGEPLSIQNELIAEYRALNGADPTGDALTQIVDQANAEAASPIASVLRGLRQGLGPATAQIAPNRWYWAATRVLSETPDGGGGAIAEFPFFTFLYGDLHAHMISMPVMFIVMAFVLNEILLVGSDRRSLWTLFIALSVGGLAAGILRATNTWDWITFMLLGVAGLGFAWWLGAKGFTRRSMIVLVLRLGVFVGMSFLLSLPYATWYASVYNRALPSEHPRTQIWMYLTVHGLFLFLILSLLIWETARWLRSVYVRSLRGQLPLLLAGFFALAAVLLMGLFIAMFPIPLRITPSGGPIPAAPVALITMPILAWITLLFLRKDQAREMRYVLALAGLAVGLTLGVELVVLDGDIGRQNTVFKFYIQAWLMFSAVGGTAVAWLIQSSGRWSILNRWTWYPAGALLLIAAGIYPLAAARGRALDRMAADVPLTLDGMTYMQYASQYEGDPELLQANPSLAPFPLDDDYHMIRWLQENVEGTPTIIEGMSASEYRWQSRVAILTGLPTVNGWNFHQRQQRTFDPLPRLVEQRVANVNAFYVTDDITTAWDILRHYNVSYVIVSGLEKAYYPAAGLAKFDDMVKQGKLTVAYEQGGAKVYQVNKDQQFALEEDVAGGV